MNLQDSPPGLHVRQFHFQPQLDPPTSYQCRRKMIEIHSCHHDADARTPFAFQTVKHRQEIAIQTPLLTIFKDRVRIIDENYGGRVFLGSLKNTMDSLIEILGPGNERAVDQEEPRNRCAKARPIVVLPEPGGPYSKTPRFGRRLSSELNASSLRGRTI